MRPQRGRTNYINFNSKNVESLRNSFTSQISKIHLSTLGKVSRAFPRLFRILHRSVFQRAGDFYEDIVNLNILRCTYFHKPVFLQFDNLNKIYNFLINFTMNHIANSPCLLMEAFSKVQNEY